MLATKTEFSTEEGNMNSYHGKSSHSETRNAVKCVCPRCGLGHVLKLPWPSGTSTPVIYCLGCQEAVGCFSENTGSKNSCNTTRKSQDFITISDKQLEEIFF